MLNLLTAMETELEFYEFASDQPNEIYYTDININFLWCCGPTLAMAAPFLRFLDHTKRRIAVGRTSLYEWSARRRDLYLKTHNTHKKEIRKTVRYIIIGRSQWPCRLWPLASWDCGFESRRWHGYFGEYCALSVVGLCVGLITCPQESYRLSRVVMYDLETSRMGRTWPALGRSATGNKCLYLYNVFRWVDLMQII
jgi:hypothetical protein